MSPSIPRPCYGIAGVVLFSTLGGLSLFGITGFVIGPLIAALFLAFWDMFTHEFNIGS